MRPGKRKRPVAATTGLEKCRSPRIRKTTTGSYHSRRPAQADCLSNIASISEILPKVWKKLEETYFQQENGGGK